MEYYSDVLFLLLGWLLGTLSPGIVDAIKEPKRRKELLAAMTTEFRELRYKLALVAEQMRGRSGTMTPATLDLVLPVISGFKGTSEDSEFQVTHAKLLDKGRDAFIAVHNARKGTGSPYPVPYRAPFLDAHLHEVGLFKAGLQERILRMRAELDLFNEQVQQTRMLHDRSFTTTEQNHAINAANYEACLERLSYRAEALIRELNAVLDSE